MRRVRRRLVETILPLLLLTLAVPARGAVLNKKARFREGPTRESTLIDWVDAGTAVSVTGEQFGWYRVVLPDGRQGYVWREHLDGVEATGDAGPGGESPPPPPSEPTRPGTLQEEVQGLRVQLEGYARDGGLAAKADLDRLSERIDELAQDHRDLRQSLDDSVFTGMRTPIDGSAIAGGAFLTIGGLIGWALARLSQRRRERRSRIRL